MLPWRIEVCPLASAHLVGAHYSFLDRLDEAERVRLRMGRSDFFGAGFQLLKPARNRADRWRLPSVADEPPGGAPSRRERFQLPPGSDQHGSSVCLIRARGYRSA